MYNEETKQEVIRQFLKADYVKIKSINGVPKIMVFIWLKKLGYNKEVKEILAMIMRYMQNEMYEEACELSHQYSRIPLIEQMKQRVMINLSKKIKELTLEGSPESSLIALGLCEIPDAQNDLVIVSQKIKLLMMMGNYLSALLECTEERCESTAICLQKISCLIRLGRYDEALEACTEERCQENERIAKEKEFLLSMKKKDVKSQDNQRMSGKKKSYTSPILNQEKNQTTSSWLHPYIKTCLTQLYQGTLSLEILETPLLTMIERIILTCAHYDKTDRSRGLHYLKNQLTIYEFTEEETKILKECLERLKMNKKIFDVTFYNQLLLKYAYTRVQERKNFRDQVFTLERSKKENNKVEG